MSQSVKCWLYKHKDLSSVSRTPVKSICAVIPVAGCRDRIRVYWVVSLVESVTSGTVRVSASTNKVEGT